MILGSRINRGIELRVATSMFRFVYRRRDKNEYSLCPGEGISKGQKKNPVTHILCLVQKKLEKTNAKSDRVTIYQ
jgi:hypothetical protein